jgi:hypothetical protein
MKVAAWISFGVVFGALADASAQVGPDETDPRKIMTAVIKRDTGDKVVSKLEFTIKDQTGSSRSRSIQAWEMTFGDGKKRLYLFEEPANVRDTGFLSVDYSDGTKTDDQFLYVPNLKKVSRIAGSGKAGSWMGTDFSYADLTDPDPSQYEYKMLEQSTKVDGEDCWLIQSTPITPKEKEETGYIDSQVWVSKSKLMTLQSKARVAAGKKLKYIKWSDIKQVSGIWRAHTIQARLVKGGSVDSETVMRFTKLEIGQPTVKDDLFTERRLTAGL